MQSLEKTLKAMRVLVMDEMDSIRNMVQSCLKELGVEEIMMSGNGESGWQILTDKPVDIIICDWDMPKLTGIELLERVRASEYHQHIPFLMLTATVEKEDVVTAVAAGVTDYLAKPFNASSLEYRILKMLRKIKQ